MRAIGLKSGFADSSVATATITIATSGGFSPLSLGPSLWFDSSDLSTLFQDAAGAVPVTADGHAIALIRDRSGNNRDLTQATNGLRPVYRTAGGLSWFEFDGTRTALLAARYTTNADSFCVAWASRKDNVADKSVIAGVTGGQTWLGDSVTGATSPSVEFYTARGQSALRRFDQASILADHVSVLNVTPGGGAHGTMRSYQNGVAGATASGVSSVSLDGLTFGVSQFVYSGRIYQFIAFPRALTTTELDDLTDWMKAKAGIA